ncbi:cuscuta receptor 1-like [Tasmannia lanceolata]|uniref:cuscuta receptor 1-like n=1 Tax=Tasmannia lanceolata TaxID=3420 RepID=UPI00406459D0
MRGLHAYSIVGVLWFVNVCCCFYGGQACLEEERKALLQLGDSINDYPNSATHSVFQDWVGEDCCQWWRVSCSNSSSRVIGIDLRGARDPNPYFTLFGVWYPNATLFAQFKELESLDLSINQIGGWVMPEGFIQMKNLKRLYLWGNMLNQSSQSLSGLCSLKRLKNLDLSDNQLDDRSLPSCLGNLSSLEDLDLSVNNLRNPIGILTGFIQMKNLKMLDLSGNMLHQSSQSLSGLCSLKRLKQLNLWGNQLDDRSLPSCLGNLSSLEDLDLYYNNLRNPLGNSTGLCGLKRLTYLSLGHNNLHDQSFPSCLGNLSSLVFLNLYGTNLTFGAISTGLCSLKRLKTLSLRRNQLDDRSLPSCLRNLSSLEDLDLAVNNFRNPFGISPGLCGLKRLLYLDLSDNNLHDQSPPSCLGNLSSLETLDLPGNNLTFTFGAISTGICKLRNLSCLDLSNNSIEGIHPCMEGMHNLRRLFLSDNRVTGKIPSFIFNNLTKIESIDLSNSQLMGVFSFSSFANLSQLLDVDLSNNVQLEVETQYPYWVPTFQLHWLSLENCNLNKHSTRTIPSFLSSQDNLYNLNLGHNSLKGIIPSWLLYNTSSDSLLLTGNLFEGSIPQSTHNTISFLTVLDISENNLSGSLPTNIGTLFPRLLFFNLSKNILQGRIPSSMGEIERLSILDLSSNNFSGEMPHQLTKNCTQLVYLNISSNRLQGDILPVDANLIRLQYLFASHNNFTGKIPSGLLNSPVLMILDMRKNTLSDTIPSWLFSLSKLVSILLGNNFFRGNIPIQLCQLSNLHTLDLSNNSFSGNIPSCLNNISSWKKTEQIQISYVSLNRTGFLPRPSTSFTTKGVTYFYEGLPFGLMTGIDLSMNQLQGDIPFQTGDLEVLHSLNFSNNLLIGYLPQSFQNLKSLESLDLSHNKLVGRIPYELSQLDSLGAFSVAYNNLSGKIPFDKHLTTFGKDSYEGNPNLCGPPLERNCSLEIPSQPPRDEGKNSRVLDNPVIFYSFMAMSYALGFWGFIGFLILNKNGRHKYFRAMDAYIDRSIEKLSEFRSYLKNCCFK